MHGPIAVSIQAKHNFEYYQYSINILLEQEIKSKNLLI